MITDLSSLAHLVHTGNTQLNSTQLAAPRPRPRPRVTSLVVEKIQCVCVTAGTFQLLQCGSDERAITQTIDPHALAQSESVCTPSHF